MQIKTRRRFSQYFPVVSLLLVVGGEVFGAAVPDALEIFDETTSIVTAKFYDRTFRGLPWEKMVATTRKKKLAGTIDEKELKGTLNDLLESLGASHTKFLSASDQEFWALKAIFSREIEGAPLAQIGAWFIATDGVWFIKNILDGSPAARAGLLKVRKKGSNFALCTRAGEDAGDPTGAESACIPSEGWRLATDPIFARAMPSAQRRPNPRLRRQLFHLRRAGT